MHELSGHVPLGAALRLLVSSQDVQTVAGQGRGQRLGPAAESGGGSALPQESAPLHDLEDEGPLPGFAVVGADAGRPVLVRREVLEQPPPSAVGRIVAFKGVAGAADQARGCGGPLRLLNAVTSTFSSESAWQARSAPRAVEAFTGRLGVSAEAPVGGTCRAIWDSNSATRRAIRSSGAQCLGVRRPSLATRAASSEEGRSGDADHLPGRSSRVTAEPCGRAVTRAS